MNFFIYTIHSFLIQIYFFVFIIVTKNNTYMDRIQNIVYLQRKLQNIKIYETTKPTRHKAKIIDDEKDAKEVCIIINLYPMICDNLLRPCYFINYAINPKMKKFHN